MQSSTERDDLPKTSLQELENVTKQHNWTRESSHPEPESSSTIDPSAVPLPSSIEVIKEQRGISDDRERETVSDAFFFSKETRSRHSIFRMVTKKPSFFANGKTTPVVVRTVGDEQERRVLQGIARLQPLSGYLIVNEFSGLRTEYAISSVRL